MPEPQPGLSYEDYLRAVDRVEELRQAWLRREPGARPPAPLGHPRAGALPETGNAEYDQTRPYQQVHSRAAMDVAGFDPRELERYRRTLEADPYGPALHVVEADGTIRPAREAERQGSDGEDPDARD
ncbi:MAG: hypothetical protein AB7T37_00845 [Dehalococcoidia bacterium]